MRYLFACFTDKGKRKGVNQDSLLVSQAMLQGQAAVLAAICDGMGGLDKGELASGEVIGEIAGWFRERFPSVARQEEFEDELYESWERLFQDLHRKIKGYGERQGIRIGTTATAMLFWQERFFVAHVGDCRIYEIKERIRQLTKDQVQGGSHILLQGIGVSKTVRPVYHSGEVKKDAVYLLCTDGFRHKVSAEELGREFASEKLSDETAMRRKAEYVARTVMERGEKDNLSALLLRTISGQEQSAISDECRSRAYSIEKEIICSDALGKGLLT